MKNKARVMGLSRKIPLIAMLILCFVYMYSNPALAGVIWNDATCEIEDDGSSVGEGPFDVAALTLSATTIYYPAGIEAGSCTFPVIE